MLDYGEERSVGREAEGRLEAARQEEITFRSVSSGDSAVDICREQANETSRTDALVLEVPSSFARTRDALEWIKEAKALEREAYGESVVERGPWQPSSVAYDSGKTLPCLVVLAPALEEIEELGTRREEEKVRMDLAEEGAVVFERVPPEAGGCLNLDDLREAMRPMLQCDKAHHGQAPALADESAGAFFQSLLPVPTGSEAYRRFPTHVEPLDEGSLQHAVEEAFEVYQDRETTPWWRLDY